MSSYAFDILNTKQVIASNLRLLIASSGKTRKALCEELSIKYTTMCDWINGRTYPRLEALETLAGYFGIGVRDFFIDIDSNNHVAERLSAYTPKHPQGSGRLMNKDAYTIEDYYNFPEDCPVELIDGHLYMMSSPETRHQEIVRELSFAFKTHIADHKGPCKVFFAPFDVFLPSEHDTVVVPDIVVVCDESKITKKGCEGVPDLVVEVLSKSTMSRDMDEKLRLYRSAGVTEYWIIDPYTDTIFKYIKTVLKPEVYHFSELIYSAVLNGFSVTLSDLDISRYSG